MNSLSWVQSQSKNVWERRGCSTRSFNSPSQHEPGVAEVQADTIPLHRRTPWGVSWLRDRTELVLRDTRLNQGKGFWRPAPGAQWWGLGVALGLPSWSPSEAPPLWFFRKDGLQRQAQFEGLTPYGCYDSWGINSSSSSPHSHFLKHKPAPGGLGEDHFQQPWPQRPNYCPILTAGGCLLKPIQNTVSYQLFFL